MYRRRVLGRLDAALARGVRRISEVYGECDTRQVRLGVGEHLVNLNTPDDYEAAVKAAGRA